MDVRKDTNMDKFLNVNMDVCLDNVLTVKNYRRYTAILVVLLWNCYCCGIVIVEKLL